MSASSRGREGSPSALAERVGWSVAALLSAALLASGLLLVPGPHDNDWPLLMWLAKRATLADPSALAIGHYPPGQLVLVRAIWPPFGSVLVAAKALNAICTGASAWLVWLAARRAGGASAGVAAVLAFATSGPAILTGQSEFGDPLALALFLAGLVLALAGDGAPRALAAGWLLGTAGAMRLHFQPFAVVTAALLVLDRTTRPDAGAFAARAASAAAMALGVLLGAAPIAALWYAQHGQLTSPVAPYFLGQVVYGTDDYDFLATWNLHSTSQVLAQAPGAVIRLLLARASQNAETWLLPCALLAIATGRRAAMGAAFRPVALLCLASIAYFAFFVAPAFRPTPRLFLPLVALLSVATAATAGRLLFPRTARLAWVLAALLLAVRGAHELPAVRERLNETERRWRLSGEITAILREHGLRDPREAFVFDWNRFLVDDPEIQPFYNFGFWNLLYPPFREERPIPTPHLGSLVEFSAFLERQDVRFVVVSRRLRRFPVLLPLLQPGTTIPGFRRLADLEEDVLFARR